LPEFHRLAERAEIVAACGRTASRVQAVAGQYNIPNRYTDYAQMLAETDAEAVINLTPIQSHLETTLAALEAGKHVYTEKPVASTVADAERIRRTAQERGLTVVCAPCVMLFPQVKYVQTLLTEGAIGPVYSARGHAHMGVPPWSGFPSDPSPYFAKGAGPAMDMGVYPLHALTGLLGPVKRVTALVAQAIHEFTVGDGPFQGKTVPVEVADNWHLVLDFGNKRLASLTANSCVQESLAPPLELYGLQGTLALDPIYVHKPVELLRPGAGWEKVILPLTGRAQGPDHHLGIEHLVDCIRQERQPILSIDHALHVVEILEQAAAASREGRTMTSAAPFEVLILISRC